MKITKNQLRKIVTEAVKLRKPLRESRFTRAAETDEQEEALEQLQEWLKELGFKSFSSTPMPESRSPRTVLVDLTHQGSEVYVNAEGEISVRGNDTAYDIHEFRQALGMNGIEIPSKPKTKNHDRFLGEI